MDFLISPAWAQGAGGTAALGAPGMELIFMIGIFFLIMYFLVIRPQNKRNKEQKNLLASLESGDEVITTGGILGKIVKISESLIQIEVQKGVVVTLQKQGVSSVVPKGTLLSIGDKPAKGKDQSAKGKDQSAKGKDQSAKDKDQSAKDKDQSIKDKDRN